MKDKNVSVRRTKEGAGIVFLAKGTLQANAQTVKQPVPERNPGYRKVKVETNRPWMQSQSFMVLHFVHCLSDSNLRYLVPG